MGETLELVTPPAVEPVTLADAKAWLRLEIADDDALVSGLITAARLECEKALRQSFITTTWRLHLDNGFPFGGGYFNRTIRQMGEGPLWLPQAGGGVFFLPKPPLQSVASITYVDTNGTTQTVDPSLYRAEKGAPCKVQPVFGKVWPIAAPVIDAVQITFTSGYGDDAAAIPANVALAVKVLTAFYYENRMLEGGDIPPGILSVLSASDHGSYA